MAEEDDDSDDDPGPMPAPPPAAKRPLDFDDDDDDDDDAGPMPAPPPAAAKVKKKKVLKNEHVYLDNLPSGEMYEKSFMHRDVVSFAAASPLTNFLITGSANGHVKFW